jgi:hypothetical protein
VRYLHQPLILTHPLFLLGCYCAERVARDATSMHQSADWGMRAFQSLMPRIKDRMRFEERGERRVTLTMMILLYNLRARMAGINQLNSFYMGALYHDAYVQCVTRLVHRITPTDTDMHPFF